MTVMGRGEELAVAIARMEQKSLQGVIPPQPAHIERVLVRRAQVVNDRRDPLCGNVCLGSDLPRFQEADDSRSQLLGKIEMIGLRLAEFLGIDLPICRRPRLIHGPSLGQIGSAPSAIPPHR